MLCMIGLLVSWYIVFDEMPFSLISIAFLLLMVAGPVVSIIKDRTLFSG